MGSVWLAICCFGLSHITSAQADPTDHPLDALSKDEIVATVDVLKAQGKITESTRFPLIELHEPPKDEVVSFRTGRPMRREAFVSAYERGSNRTFEAVVDLKAKTLLSWKEISGVQPSLLEDDAKILEQAIRGDVRWQEAMRKRGITDLEDVVIIDWAGGYFGFHDEEGFRFERGVSYYRGSSKSATLRPIEGVVAYVNLNTGKVFKFVDTGVVPIPKLGAGLGAISVDKSRNAPKHSRLSSGKEQISKYPAAKFVGKTGDSVLPSGRARVWCSTRWATKTAADYGPCSIAGPFLKWLCRTATPARGGSSRMPSTRAKTAWVAMPIRSSQ